MGQKIDFSTEFLPLMQLKTYQLWGRFALRARIGIGIFVNSESLVLSSNNSIFMLNRIIVCLKMNIKISNILKILKY